MHLDYFTTATMQADVCSAHLQYSGTGRTFGKNIMVAGT